MIVGRKCYTQNLKLYSSSVDCIVGFNNLNKNKNSFHILKLVGKILQYILVKIWENRVLGLGDISIIP